MFQFLTQFVEEADVHQLPEAQDSVLVSRVLTGTAREQIDTDCGEYSKRGLMASPEIVDYLLGNYATPKNI